MVRARRAISTLDLQLQFRPVVQIDLAHSDLWARQVLVDAERDDIAAVSGDTATLEWIRDRIARSLDSVVVTRIDTLLEQLRSNVKDGDLAPDPVAEGTGWAVVWRRTTVAATKRSLEDAAPQIRTTIYRERTEANEKRLIEELKKAKVKDYDPEPLKIIELPMLLDAGLSLPRSIPSVSPPPPKK